MTTEENGKTETGAGIIDDEHDDTNGDGIVSLNEFIKEQQDLEDDARAVLGGSDDGNCTYDKGYVKRQAIYSCLTCVPKTAPESAGVCLACCLQCHDGHELIELYTKRIFRCDCGNGKFGNFVCRLCPTKDASNEKNKYNHNFLGEYCTCNRPYPDPDNDTDDEMIQCVGCEDWFHSLHLDSSVPSEENFSEMVCQSCIGRWPFLRSYAAVPSGDQSKDTSKSDHDTSLDISSLNGEKAAADNKQSPQLDKNVNGVKLLECSYFNMTVAVTGKGAIFFTDGWRERLCRCEQCLEMYEVHGCMFLTDPADTVQHYEELGKMKHEAGSGDSLETFLSQQDRVVQIEMAHGYNEMKEALTNYLKGFAEKRKVVSANDVREFFDDLKARKRQRTTLDDPCSSSGGGGSQ